MLEEIDNYIKINEQIITSGQPTLKQLEHIKNKNFEVIINLALCNSDNALEDEDKIVTNLNMQYFHIPVNFDSPSLKQASIFLNILNALKNKKVWIHCAKNYRVTAFMYLYHKHILQTSFDEIDLSIFDEWSPSSSWQYLMKVSFEELELNI